MALVLSDTYNYISQKSLARAIDAVPDLKIRKWIDKDVAMLLQIMYWAGLRPGEAVRLRKQDFDFGRREIDLGSTKTKKRDAAVIPAVFAPVLAEYLAAMPDGPLLPRLTYDRLYHWLKKLGAMCDIPAWTEPQEETGEKTVGHGLRKSVGKDMLNGDHGTAAQQIPVIQRHMRHSKPSTTIDYYLRAGLEQVKNAW